MKCEQIADRIVTDMMDRKHPAYIIVRIGKAGLEYLDSTDPDVWISDRSTAMASEDKRWILGHAERRGAFIECRSGRGDTIWPGTNVRDPKP